MLPALAFGNWRAYFYGGEMEKAKIDELKKKYGRIFKCVIDGKDYIYRPLLRSEYREMQKAIPPELMMSQEGAALMEDKMAETCVVYPENFKASECDAGVPSLLATYISTVSGFKVDQEPVEL